MAQASNVRVVMLVSMMGMLLAGGAVAYLALAPSPDPGPRPELEQAVAELDDGPWFFGNAISQADVTTADQVFDRCGVEPFVGHDRGGGIDDPGRATSVRFGER